MLVTVQLPFTDARHFLPRQTTGLLPVAPAFPTLTPGESFIRAFGPLRRRRRGGVSAWPGEELYADARRAIRFADGFGPEEHQGDWWERSAKKAAFRRLLCDGTATTRVEVGLAIRGFSVSAPSANEITEKVLELPVWVRDDSDQLLQSSLGQSSLPLAKHFMRSTTELAASPTDPPGWWCQSAPTAVLIETTAVEPPHRATNIVAGLEKQGIELYHWYHEYGAKDVDVWLMRDKSGTWGVSRKVRIHLLRLHAEWHALRMVLQHLARDHIVVEPRTEHSDSLQQFLNDKTHLILKRRLDGVPQSELLEAAYQSDQLVHEGERASLRRALEKARPNIRRKFEEAATTAVPRLLLLTANPASTTKMNVGEELTQIQDALGFGPDRQVDFTAFLSTERTELQKRLNGSKAHIVHISAHTDEVGEIVFEGDAGQAQPVKTSALAEMFKLQKTVRCVILNACSSIEIAEAINEHVDIVFGTTRDVMDPDALLFTKEFYTALGNGDDVQRAYDLAVIALKVDDRPNVTELLARKGVNPSKMTLKTILEAGS